MRKRHTDSEMVDWSMLPEDVIRSIAVRLFSIIELLRFRSICTSWGSSVLVSDNNHPFPIRPIINLDPLIVKLATNSEGTERIYGLDRRAFLSRANFFCLTLSSSPGQGWLIKYDPDRNYGIFHVLNPLSRLPYSPRLPYGRTSPTINLLEFTVSEIQAAYVVQKEKKNVLNSKDWFSSDVEFLESAATG